MGSAAEEMFGLTCMTYVPVILDLHMQDDFILLTPVLFTSSHVHSLVCTPIISSHLFPSVTSVLTGHHHLILSH